MTAGSFSGCHPFRIQCLREQLLTEWPGYHRDEYGDDLEDYVAEREADPDDQAVVITSTIDAGRCPRCDELFPADRLPAGSRVTACRCIPVCPACGDHEALVVMPAISWPWPAVHIREQVSGWMQQGKAGPAIFTGETLITDNGVTSVRKRPYPGGWAEFRYDDRADRAEQRGRAGGAP